MRAAVLLPIPLAAALFCSTGCSPSEGSVKSAIESKSFCNLNDFKVQGDPKEDREGYVRYEFSAMVNCKGSRSFWGAKITEPTAVAGYAEMKPKYFGIMYDLSKYDFPLAEKAGGGGTEE